MDAKKQKIEMDDTIACVLGMGFDMEDCTQAMAAGKTKAEEIVEWILAGKPAEKRVLKLRPVGGEDPSPSTSAANLPAQEEESPVSRYHLNDEQRKDKKRFEEKVRKQTEKEVKTEKQQAKMERERVLKQIHEDREKLKERQQRNLPPQSAPEDSAAPTGTGVPLTPGPRAKCEIKIRLPDGAGVLQHTFQASDTLNDVYHYVTANSQSQLEDAEFVQPFPPHTFPSEAWARSLEELKLTPASTLVLKQAGTPPGHQAVAPPAAQFAAESSDEENGEEEEEEDEEDNRQVAPPRRPGGGGGGGLPGFRANAGVRQLPFGGMGLGPNPGRGDPGARGFPDVPGYVMVPQDYAFGHNQNQSAAELAAQAAEQRFAQADATPKPSSMAPTCSLHLVVPSLLRLAMDHLARRLSEQRQPYLHSLGPITSDLATKFLEFLKHECQLKPRTLSCFLACYLNSLSLDCYPHCTNELLHAVRLHTNLVFLSLHACPLITDHGFKHLATLKRLKTLNVGGCRQLTDQIFQTIAELPNIQCLNLEETAVTDAGVAALVASQPQHLTSINLNRTNVTEKCLQALRNITGLRTLCLEDTKVCSLSGIQEMRMLECLNVAHTGIVTDSLLCLQNHPSLISLNLTGTERVSGNLALDYIQGLHLQQLVLPSRHTIDDQGLIFLPTLALTGLDLTNFSHVTNEGMLHVGKIHSLRKLLLCNTKISDAGLHHLKDLINLVELHLDRTIVTDTGVSVIKKFSQLEELSLSSTGITSRLLQSGTLNGLNYLRRLNLSRTNVCDKGIVYLKSKSLTLLNLDCTRIHPQVEEIIRQNCPGLEKVTLANLSAVMEVDEEEAEEEL